MDKYYWYPNMGNIDIELYIEQKKKEMEEYIMTTADNEILLHLEKAAPDSIDKLYKMCKQLIDKRTHG